MGIYDIQLGKGIIVPHNIFIKTNEKIIKNIMKGMKKPYDGFDILDRAVKKIYGQEYEFSPIGHDAFNSRSGSMEIFTNDNEINFIAIKNLLKIKIDSDSLPFDFPSCGELIFIGKYQSIEANDMEYYVKTPELLYGLPALLPSLIKVYQKMIKIKCDELINEFNQTPCIWTFATDCHCCG